MDKDNFDGKKPESIGNMEKIGVESVFAPTTGQTSTDVSMEELIRLYVGPNANKFITIYQAQVTKKFVWSFNWIVLFASTPWYFYRKLYLIGTAILLLPVIAFTVFPSLGDIGTISIAGVLAFTANGLYVDQVKRRIEKLKMLNLSAEELKSRIQREGGTSPGGAIFGILIMVAVVGISIMGALPNSFGNITGGLATCDNPQVHQHARRFIEDMLKRDEKNLPLTDAAATFETTEDGADGSYRICKITFQQTTGLKSVYLHLSPTDGFSGRTEIVIGDDPQGLKELGKMNIKRF